MLTWGGFAAVLSQPVLTRPSPIPWPPAAHIVGGLVCFCSHFGFGHLFCSFSLEESDSAKTVSASYMQSVMEDFHEETKACARCMAAKSHPRAGRW